MDKVKEQTEDKRYNLRINEIYQASKLEKKQFAKCFSIYEKSLDRILKGTREISLVDVDHFIDNTGIKEQLLYSWLFKKVLDIEDRKAIKDFFGNLLYNSK